MNCPQAREYLRSLPPRFEQEAKTLASLTGWNINDIRRKMKENGQDITPGPIPEPNPQPWWENMWNK